MPTVKITSEVSTEQLLHSVANLPANDLEAFVAKVLTLRAKLKAPSIPTTEVQLLTHINQGLPAQEQKRWTQLEQKRQEETLTPEEHQELLKLNDQLEQLNVVRMQALTKLAFIRQISITTLMQNLGIRTPDYA